MLFVDMDQDQYVVGWVPMPIPWIERTVYLAPVPCDWVQ